MNQENTFELKDTDAQTMDLAIEIKDDELRQVTGGCASQPQAREPGECEKWFSRPGGCYMK